jgi:hypothetical protein
VTAATVTVVSAPLIRVTAMSSPMSAAEGILMLLIVQAPGEEPLPCPWGSAVNRDGDPCDGRTCPLCHASELRRDRA